MLMKDIMREKGLVNESTIKVTCVCGAGALIDPVKNEYIISPLMHESNCLYINACGDLGVNPHDLNDERVRRVLYGDFSKKLF